MGNEKWQDGWNIVVALETASEVMESSNRLAIEDSQTWKVMNAFKLPKTTEVED